MSKSAPKIARLDTPLAPVALSALVMNTKGLADRSLFYICRLLIRRLEKVPELPQYLRIAYILATTANEEQACALAQSAQRRISGLPAKRASDDSFSAALYNYSTFSSGMLPANLSCDPVTHLWKLFQQGAPLCAVYNAVNPSSEIARISTEDPNVTKRSVYSFVTRCREDLGLRDDELFPIMAVFSGLTDDLLRVIHVVNAVLDLSPKYTLRELEKAEILGVASAGPRDARTNVVRELVETERKYVQDLETMLAYKNELRRAELVPLEALRTLFPNLQEIVDIQRRLLVGLEANALAPPKLQRIGLIFLHLFEPFKAYEPWSVGQKAAAEIVQQEMANLERLSQIIRGELEINSFLLKPVQRLCKYPLLLKELVKHTDKTWPHYNELVNALQALRETAAHVNEAQRKVENLVQLRELQERVTDWKGYDINSFGDLMYHLLLGVRDSDTEREFNVYLFEQIILFFKEASKDLKKKKKSSMTEAPTKPKLELKGRIYIPNIYNILLNSAGSSVGHLLTVSWSGSRDLGSFVMRFRSEETRGQWESCLRELVTLIREDVSSDYRSYLSSDLRSQSVDGGRYALNHYGHAPIKHRQNLTSYLGNYTGSTQSDIAEARNTRLASTPALNGFKNLAQSTLASNMSGLTLADPSTPLSADECIKIKLLYKQDIFTLLVPRNLDLAELKKRIEKKLKQCGALITLDTMKIRYQDEEGDYIAIDSTEDWSLAQEVVDEIIDNSGDNILSIWVIQI